MMRPLFTTALLLSTAFSPAFAWQTKTDSTGATVRWSKEVTFLVAPGIGEALGDDGARAAIDAALAEVEQAAPGLSLRAEDGEGGGVGYDLTAGAQNHSVIVADDVWAYDENLIAVTIVTLDARRHEILDADIAFNTKHRRFKVLPQSSNPGGAFDDIQNTLTHELGHAVGLAHNPEVLEAVMYPGARRGEVSKRTLSDDDVDGLLSLYPEGSGPDLGAGAPGALGMQNAVGCSMGGSGVALWILAFVAPLWLWRRRPAAARTPRAPTTRARTVAPALAAVSLGLPLAAHAQSISPLSPEARDDLALTSASLVLTGQVVASHTLPPEPNARLLWSELEVRVRECLKGDCPATARIRVPGGRVGDIEQVVEDHPVPEAGDVVGLAIAPHTPERRARSTVFRLSEARELIRFARALGRVQLALPAALPVSSFTSRSPGTQHR